MLEQEGRDICRERWSLGTESQPVRKREKGLIFWCSFASFKIRSAVSVKSFWISWRIIQNNPTKHYFVWSASLPRFGLLLTCSFYQFFLIQLSNNLLEFGILDELSNNLLFGIQDEFQSILYWYKHYKSGIRKYLDKCRA